MPQFRNKVFQLNKKLKEELKENELMKPISLREKIEIIWND